MTIIFLERKAIKQFKRNMYGARGDDPSKNAGDSSGEDSLPIRWAATNYQRLQDDVPKPVETYGASETYST